jgi:hypothetical protein
MVLGKLQRKFQMHEAMTVNNCVTRAEDKTAKWRMERSSLTLAA